MILKRQPRNESGPFTQAQLLQIKGMPGRRTVHRPWKTGNKYPYASAKRGGLGWQDRAQIVIGRLLQSMA